MSTVAALAVVALSALALVIGMLADRPPRRCPHPGCTSPVGYHVHIPPPDHHHDVDGRAKRG